MDISLLEQASKLENQSWHLARSGKPSDIAKAADIRAEAKALRRQWSIDNRDPHAYDTSPHHPLLIR